MAGFDALKKYLGLDDDEAAGPIPLEEHTPEETEGALKAVQAVGLNNGMPIKQPDLSGPQPMEKSDIDEQYKAKVDAAQKKLAPQPAELKPTATPMGEPLSESDQARKDRVMAMLHKSPEQLMGMATDYAHNVGGVGGITEEIGGAAAKAAAQVAEEAAPAVEQGAMSLADRMKALAAKGSVKMKGGVAPSVGKVVAENAPEVKFSGPTLDRLKSSVGNVQDQLTERLGPETIDALKQLPSDQKQAFLRSTPEYAQLKKMLGLETRRASTGVLSSGAMGDVVKKGVR